MAADRSVMYLNGFGLDVRPSVFTAYTRAMPEPGDLEALRDDLAGRWTLWWRGGVVYGVPLAEATGLDAVPVQLTAAEHLDFVTYLINEALPRSVPYYNPFRRRPFSFLGEKGEFVAEIARTMRGLPPIVAGFTIRPRYVLQARWCELAGTPTVGLFVKLFTRCQIGTGLTELAAAGVDLAGLDVIWRTPKPGQRRLVGRIEHLAGDEVVLSESLDGRTRVSAADVAVEGSRASFAHCLRATLGSRYEAFERHRQRLEGLLLGGPGIEKMLAKMHTFLTRNSPLQISSELGLAVGARLTVTNSDQHRGVLRSRPVEYCFDASRSKRDELPWRGLERFGPFSRDTFAIRSPRILFVFPDTVQGTVETFLRALRDGIPGGGGYPSGFAATFRLANPAFVPQRVTLPVSGTGAAHTAYRRAIESSLGDQQRYDAAIVVIPDELADLPDSINPYLHAKALLLMAGVASQQVKISTIAQRPAALSYTLRNIAIALYGKMNGIPWTVDHDLTIADEIVIGLGVAELSGGRFAARRRYVGVTTVFRGDGNYLLGNLSRECRVEDYPDALRESVIDTLREIKARNGWQVGDTVRVVCHTTNPLRVRHLDTIMSDCLTEVGAAQHLEFAFLTVTKDHPFAVLDPDQPGRPAGGGRKGALAPGRGTIVEIGVVERLLATSGPMLANRPDAPLPHPLLIRLHARSTFRDATYLTEQVLKFTSLSWRSTMPARRPVTIYYSELIAELLARLRSVPDWSSALLNARLKHSRWFL